MNNNIQQILDQAKGIVVLPPGEFEGPFYIDHPCTVEGNGTTLWCGGDAVIVIDSPDVTLRNLRIEMIDTGDGHYSVCASSEVKTENVEIIGLTSGFGEEDLCPELTKQLKLGTFRSDEQNSFVFELYSPGYSQIETDIQDIIPEPSKLVPGINRIKISTERLPSGTFLYGDLLMKSAFVRRFYLHGTVSDTVETVTEMCISTVDTEKTEKLKASVKKSSEVVKSLISGYVRASQDAASPVSNEQQKRTPDIKSTADEHAAENKPSVRRDSAHVLLRGERISINEFSGKPIRIYMSYRALFKQIDIDPYAFMLDETGVTSCDDDFVFFGNRETMSGALTFMEDNSIKLDLSRVPAHIKKISFVYSIYQPSRDDNFSKVMDPFVSLVQDESEIVRYTASELYAETTIIFMEIYRHSSGWKLNTVGQGYREGLKRLCANYGLIVS